ncbi:MAG: hypothetical protein ACR2QA_10945 [Solirubrobacteraceae bacterium]
MALLSAVAICGCGGTSLSTAQLRRQATRICAAARVRTVRIPTPVNPAGGAAFLAGGTAVLSPELAALRRLTPTGDPARTYMRTIDAFSQMLAELHAGVIGLHRGSDPVIVIKTLQAHLAPLESVQQRGWEALGIPACVNQ